MSDMATGAGMSQVRKGAGWLVALGILTALVGSMAIASPLIVGLAFAIVLGSMLAVGGVFQMVHAFRAVGLGKGIFAFLSGLLALACGGVMVVHPQFGLGVLTLILIFYFLLDGICKVISSFSLRPARGWGWMLFSGIVTLALALMIWRKWPLSGTWAIGVLVGVNLLFDGLAMVSFGGVVRENVPSPAQDA